MKRICLAAIAVGGLFMFTACGSDDTGQDAPAADTQGSGQQGGGQGGGMPGASGKIAAADGSTIQVQGNDSQTAVTYTDETTISQQVAGSLSDVKAGLCVTVTPAEGSESSDTAVTAGSVRVTEKSDGSCQGGFGGGRPSGMPEGGMPSGMPEGEEMPSGAPDGGMPSGGPGAGGRFGTSGEVTAVSGDTITVAATSFDPQAEEGTEPETTSVTVTTTGETTVTITETADATALTIGRCVTATGTSDDTGAVSAERIEVSDAVDGECSTGFGRGGFPGGGGGSQDGASS